MTSLSLILSIICDARAPYGARWASLLLGVQRQHSGHFLPSREAKRNCAVSFIFKVIEIPLKICCGTTHVVTKAKLGNKNSIEH